MEKPRVGYTKPRYIAVGHRAVVFVPNHPNHLIWHNIGQNVVVTTSTVLSYDDETGEFETLNTIYYPL
jgi:hypothetical protein